MEFRELRPINPDIAAQQLGISRRTVFRYDKEPTRLANLAAAHLAGVIHSPHWHGWTIKDDALITPFNDAIPVGHILAMVFQHQLISELKKQVELLRKENEKLKRQPSGPANDECYRIVTR